MKECHFCECNISPIRQNKVVQNEKLNKPITIGIPAWKCKECGRVIYPTESLRILHECKGIEKGDGKE